MNTITSVEFNAHIKRIALTISTQPLGLVIHRPTRRAKPMECFANVEEKMHREGGKAALGWYFLYRLVADLPGPGYVIAVHHAVWHAPDGQLIDVTPFDYDPKHQPHTVNGDVLFLVDSQAVPVSAPNGSAPLASRFYPLSSDERLVRHLDQVRIEEQRVCAQLYRGLGPPPLRKP